jgi:hypothetical protein
MNVCVHVRRLANYWLHGPAAVSLRGSHHVNMSTVCTTDALHSSHNDTDMTITGQSGRSLSLLYDSNFEDTEKTSMNLEDILWKTFSSPEKEYVVTFNKHVEVKSSHSRIQHRKQQVYTVAKWWPNLSASFRWQQMLVRSTSPYNNI